MKNNIIETKKLYNKKQSLEDLNIYNERNNNFDKNYNDLNYFFKIRELISLLNKFQSTVEKSTVVLAAGGNNNILKMYDKGQLWELLGPSMKRNKLLTILYDYVENTKHLKEYLDNNLSKEKPYVQNLAGKVDEELGFITEDD